MPIRPIFLFSISRSGSTLAQRVIAAHEGVATAAEPWLLLPYAYALRSEGVRAEYFHPLLVDAISDFARQLPGGIDDYRDEVRQLALRLYERAAQANGGASCFLDKSPAYYLVADEIMRLFPEGRFVFLWRNPLSVMASIVDTFHGGRWCPSLFRGDMFIGLPRLLEAYVDNIERAHAVRFEDLTAGEEAPWRVLLGYLGIDFDPDSLARFADVKLVGRMGDPTGVGRYSALSREPERKWRASLANPLRKEYCRRYLRYLGERRLATMGYELQALIAELDALPVTGSSLASDAGRLALDLVKEPVRVRIRRDGIGGPSVIRELLAV
jgi:hypothetical protein